VECLPANKPWDVVSVTRLSSGVALRACVRVYARAVVLSKCFIHTYIRTHRSTCLTQLVEVRVRVNPNTFGPGNKG